MNPLFYFLLALAAVLATTANADGSIFDIDGYVMYPGSYYVLPLFTRFAGGLTLAPRGDNQCPLYVGQEDEGGRGIPVKFSNWRSRVWYVPESENLNIEMDVKATTCVQSTYWWVADMESKTSLIVAGPNPERGEDSSKSFFQIKRATEQFHDSYKIAFCPNDSDCIDVGIRKDEYGLRRLALSSTPFPFVFKRATESATSSKTI